MHCGLCEQEIKQDPHAHYPAIIALAVGWAHAFCYWRHVEGLEPRAGLEPDAPGSQA